MTDLLDVPLLAGETEHPTEPTVTRRIVRFQGTQASEIENEVIGEIRLTIFVNGRELVTLMCSPWKLHWLTLGFLFLEGLISSAAEVELMRVCLEDRLVEVRLSGERPPITPAHRILTSGCSGGTSFGAYLAEIDRLRLDDGPRFTPHRLYELMRELHQLAGLYRRARGCHTSVLADGGGVLVHAEDIGRHNTLDKIQGACLLQGTEARGKILLSSGRISSEMLLKSALMGVPVVGSRTSPTALAVLLAERLNVTVVGYIRQDRMNVYSHPWRLGA